MSSQLERQSTILQQSPIDPRQHFQAGTTVYLAHRAERNLLRQPCCGVLIPCLSADSTMIGIRSVAGGIVTEIGVR